MNLIDFPESNTVYAKNQPEYLPLPAHKVLNDPQGRLICCWELSWKERWQLLTTGRIWHHVLTFNQPLQPQLLSIDSPFTPTVNGESP